MFGNTVFGNTVFGGAIDRYLNLQVLRLEGKQQQPSSGQRCPGASSQIGKQGTRADPAPGTDGCWVVLRAGIQESPSKGSLAMGTASPTRSAEKIPDGPWAGKKPIGRSVGQCRQRQSCPRVQNLEEWVWGLSEDLQV